MRSPASTRNPMRSLARGPVHGLSPMHTPRQRPNPRREGPFRTFHPFRRRYAFFPAAVASSSTGTSALNSPVSSL